MRIETVRPLSKTGVGVVALWVLLMLWAAPAPAAQPALESYTTPLPLPADATPIAPNSYRFTMQQTTQQLHPAFGPVTKVWGYDDGTHGTSYPGPTLEVQAGTPTAVEWVNGLPSEHLLPVDTRFTAGNSDDPLTLTHFHGGFIPAAADGNPALTPGFAAGATQAVTYPNVQPAAPTWYHDHAMGMTRLNVMAGLAGFLLSRDADDTGDEPNPLGVPGGAYEIPLAIQDRQFTEDGQIDYPTQPAPLGPWVPEFFGDNAVVNGAVTPYAEVEPRMYRFRILNGSNARFYNLRIDRLTADLADRHRPGTPHEAGAAEGHRDRARRARRRDRGLPASAREEPRGAQRGTAGRRRQPGVAALDGDAVPGGTPRDGSRSLPRPDHTAR